MKKIISVLLLAVMLISMLAACANDNTPADTSGKQISDDTSVPDGDQLVIDETKLDGYIYTILVAGNIDYNDDYGSDFFFDEEGSDRVDSARANWIKETEEKFDIKIDPVTKLKFGDCDGDGQGYQAIQMSYDAEDPTYDSCMIGVYDMATLARNGLLTDLNTLQYLNLKNSWWDQVANKDLAIHGKMYYTTGDISIIDNVFTHCVLFNKGLAKQYNMTDLYSYVDNDAWTVDQFFTLVKQGSRTTSEGLAANQNSYGLLTWNDSMLQVMAAADERIATVNASGELEFTMYNTRTQSLYTDWVETAMNTAYAFNYQTDVTSDEAWDTVRKRMFDSD